jgi:hypothetical protein
MHADGLTLPRPRPFKHQPLATPLRGHSLRDWLVAHRVAHTDTRLVVQRAQHSNMYISCMFPRAFVTAHFTDCVLHDECQATSSTHPTSPYSMCAHIANTTIMARAAAPFPFQPLSNTLVHPRCSRSRTGDAQPNTPSRAPPQPDLRSHSRSPTLFTVPHWRRTAQHSLACACAPPQPDLRSHSRSHTLSPRARTQSRTRKAAQKAAAFGHGETQSKGCTHGERPGRRENFVGGTTTTLGTRGDTPTQRQVSPRLLQQLRVHKTSSLPGCGGLLERDEFRFRPRQSSMGLTG